MLKSVTAWLGVSSTAAETDKCNGEGSKGADESAQTDSEQKGNVEGKSTKTKATTEGLAKNDNPSETEKALSEEDEVSLEDSTVLLVLENASTVAVNTAQQVGNFLYNFGKATGTTVVEQATKLKSAVQEKKMLGHFNQEQEKFSSDKRILRKIEEDAVAPWVGYMEEDVMKEQILALSTDKRNFLTDPPSEVKFEFDFATSYPVAMATLRQDANLRKMRFDLVPRKTKEEKFWRNYFYRVSLIKQAIQMQSLEEQQQAGARGGKTEGDRDPGGDSRAVTLTSPHVQFDPQQTTQKMEESESANKEEEDIGADWERVRRQDVEGYDDTATPEGPANNDDVNHATAKGQNSAEQPADDSDDVNREALDLMDQIEQETQKAVC